MIRFVDLSVSFYAAIFLLVIYFRAKKFDSRQTIDWFGLIFLSLSMFVWSGRDLYNILSEDIIMQLTIETWQFSIFSSTFLLAALPFFKHSFRPVKKKLSVYGNKIQWAFRIILANTFIIVVCTAIWNWLNIDTLYYVSDMYFILVFCTAVYALVCGFLGRGKTLSFIISALLIILFIVFTQVVMSIYIIDPVDMIEIVIVDAHMIFVALLLILALYWVEEIIVKPEHLIINQLREEILTIDSQSKESIDRINALEMEQKKWSNELGGLDFGTSGGPPHDGAFSSSIFQLLTTREKEVFRLLADDITYREIGKELFIAKETVISNVRSIEKKIGIKGKARLIKVSKDLHDI